MAAVNNDGQAGNMAQMQKAFTDAQNVQAEITSLTMKHQTIMQSLQAIKNAFQAIKA